MAGPLERLCTLLLTGSTRCRLYGVEHRLTREAVDQLFDMLTSLLAEEREIRLMVSGDEVLALDERLDASNGPAYALVRRLQEKGIGLLNLCRGMRRDEVEALCLALGDRAGRVTSAAHVQVGGAEASGAPLMLPESLRVCRPRGRRDDPVPDEARQVQGLTRLVQQSYDVRARDFREVALSLLAHLTHQGNVFLNLAELREHNLFTYLHTCNVATLVMGYSLSLGVSGAQAFELGTAALMHDLGKTLVPAGILDKPGELTEEEWVIVRRHPARGARLLLGQPDVPHLAVVVAFEHHMHFYGGGGYPKAPFGPSLHAQIVAIADTFDAVFGKRSYRDRYDVLQAIEILQSDRGWLYNPELADEFCRFITAQLDQSDAAGLAAEPAVS